MFRLKAPLTHEGGSNLDLMETRGEYQTLEDAIEAALKDDLDLAHATIEKDGILHPVNGWIRFRIAGGCYRG